jgi:hypothetical protein
MVMRVILQKEPMVFRFRKMFPHKVGEIIDKMFNLDAAQAGGKGVGKVLVPGKLQKTGKGLAIQILVKAEADLGGRKGVVIHRW